MLTQQKNTPIKSDNTTDLYTAWYCVLSPLMYIDWSLTVDWLEEPCCFVKRWLASSYGGVIPWEGIKKMCYYQTTGCLAFKLLLSPCKSLTSSLDLTANFQNLWLMLQNQPKIRLIINQMRKLSVPQNTTHNQFAYLFCNVALFVLSKGSVERKRTMNLYKCSRAMYNIQQPLHQLNIQHSSVHRGNTWAVPINSNSGAC